MSFWSMSVSGGIFILAIVIIRSLFADKLPGKVFQVLWLAAVLRLMIPFSIPSAFSIYSLAADYIPISYNHAEKSISEMLPFLKQRQTDSQKEAEEWNSYAQLAEEENGFGQIVDTYYDQQAETENVAEQEESLRQERDDFSIWRALYWGGAGICGLYYVFTYIRCLREFRTSLPVEKTVLQEKINAFSIKRKITVRQWDLAAAPLTYGIFHPVILLPKTLIQENQEQINFVLIHEYMHIRCLDALKKLVLVIVCCIHWFNPLVWVMSMLANRDIELACDQNVVKYLGQETRSAYALTLIYMEEKRNVRITWGNSFSKNAMEERIVAIMREKKDSLIIGVLSGVLSAGLVLAFTTSAISARDRAKEYSYIEADEIVENGMPNQNVEAFASETEDVAETTKSWERPEQQEATTAVYDASYDSSSSAQEQTKGVAVSVPPEYAAYGITADDHTGGWRYDGKEVAVLYDKGYHLFTTEASSKKAVYLKVHRDSKNRIKSLQELDKKQMQELLEDTGLVFE